MACSTASVVPLRLIFGQIQYCNEYGEWEGLPCIPVDSYRILVAKASIAFAMVGVVYGAWRFLDNALRLPIRRRVTDLEVASCRTLHSMALFGLAHYAFYQLPIERINEIVYPLSIEVTLTAIAVGFLVINLLL